MKKVLCILLAVCVVCALSACGEAQVDPGNSPPYGEVPGDPDSAGCAAPPITIWNSGEDFKDKLIKEARKSKIEEFYFPALEIDGYEIYYLYGGDNHFTYSYGVPKEEKYHGMYASSYEINIEILIEIPEKSHAATIDMDIVGYLKMIARDNKYSFTEDGFVYGGDNSIFGGIEQSFFRISLPRGQNNYDYLRDLAFQLIETAELVVVEPLPPPPPPPPPLIILNAGKDNLLAEINKAKTTHSIEYSDNNAAEIKEFYFPALEIDGFSLAHITITQRLFGFAFTTDGQDSDTYIIIETARDRRTKVPRDLLNHTYRDGLTYDTVSKDISGYIGGLYFKIRSSSDNVLSEGELRALALRLKETAELITIES